MKFRANYKLPLGSIIQIEFEHEFEEDFEHDNNIISEAINLADNSTMIDLQVGYLIYNSIRKV